MPFWKKDNRKTLNGPLDGLKIVEVADMVSAPYCGKILADLGAEVVKVEKPIRGDQARYHGPFFDNVSEPDNSILFYYLNQGKLGVTLDVRRPEGIDILYRLLTESDVLIEDICSSKKGEYGVEPEAIKKIESRPIHISVTAMGCTGPNKDYKTHHINRCMAGGEGSFVYADKEHLDHPPAQLPGYLTDYEAGVGAAIAVLAAYFHRQSAGRGQFIDFSMQEWSLMLNGLYLAKYPNENILLDRHEMDYKFGGRMRCKDGHFNIALLTDHHWWRLIELMGDPPWAHEKRLDTQFKRLSHGEEVNALIEKWFLNFSKKELYHKLQKAGIPAAPVFSPGEVLESIQMKHRNFFISQDHPRVGKLTMPSIPYRFSKSRYEKQGPAPGLGEHNFHVYNRIGFSNEDIERLQHEEII